MNKEQRHMWRSRKGLLESASGKTKKRANRGKGEIERQKSIKKQWDVE